MADKWEMCLINEDGELYFFTPGTEIKKTKISNYLQTKGMGKSAVWIKHAHDVYPGLLDDGWEPFATTGILVLFRRKYQG